MLDSKSKAPTSLGHMPNGKWEFDEAVVTVFDDMLARSIPDLATMRDLVFEIGSKFAQPSTDIVDLGCSRGAAMARFLELLGPSNRFVGVDTSAPMLAACRERFADEIARGRVEIRQDDLRTTYPPVRASLTLSVLTLQFVPQAHRARVLADAWRSTVPGGALILVEKLRGRDREIDDMLVDIYHSTKRSMGYSQEEIDRKRLSLQGVLVPNSGEENEQLLRDAGFTLVECFWRYLCFGGWIAIKTEVDHVG
jgi:tRNA (cmo5U34)-methyltransferase